MALMVHWGCLVSIYRSALSNMGVVLWAGVMFMGVALAHEQPRSKQDVMVVYDASGSMWGQIDGVTKIEIARDVMADFLARWPQDTRLGLVAYGHRRQKDCQDIETLISPGMIDRPAFLEAVNQITPRGRTPLSAAVEHAASELGYKDRPATVLLVSDGIENCAADPCALAAKLARQGVNFTAHVIGFDVNAQTQKQLACIAESTGGQFVAAKDAAQLQQAMMTVQTEIERYAEPNTQTKSETSRQVEIDTPETVLAGARFEVQWHLSANSPSNAQLSPDIGDRIGLSAEGAANDELQGARRLTQKMDHRIELTAPGEAGRYEVRYVQRANGNVAGRSTIQVVDPEIELTAPGKAVAGERFEVTWSDAVNPLDRVGIVSSGASDGQFGNYLRVRQNNAGLLTAPSDPGLYEVRYMLSEGGVTVATAPVEVIAAQVTLQAPESVNAGAQFPVSWSETVNQDDFVTVVLQGTSEGELGNRVRVRGSRQANLTAPSEPGSYEVRYVLYEDRRTVGRVPMAVVQSDVQLQVPQRIKTGERFPVSWSDAINPNDFVVVVPLDAPDDDLTTRIRVRGDQTIGTLTAPAAPGVYEVRYVMYESGQVLARELVEIVTATASISAPLEVVAGSRFLVTWSETINQNDFIAIAPRDAPASDLSSRSRAGRNRLEATLTAPAEPGEYEVRYVLYEGGDILASAPVTVVAPSVDLQSVPSVLAGSRFEVSWTQTINQNDFLTIVEADAPLSALGNRVRAGRNKTRATLTAPADSGRYEVRYVMHQGSNVLASVPVEVRDPQVELAAPSRVRAGDRFEISWTPPVNLSDTVTIVEQGADERATGPRTRVGTGMQGHLTAPVEPGPYEIRYILQQGGKVIARKQIEVIAKD